MGSEKWHWVVIEENYLCSLSSWRVSFRLVLREENEHRRVSRKLVFWGTSPLRSHCGTEVFQDIWMDALVLSHDPMLDSPLILVFLVPCSTEPYNTAAILCSLACASQVLIPSCFWGWPCDDSCLAAYQRFHLELAHDQTEGCSVTPRNLTQCGLPAFQWVLDSLSAHVCQTPARHTSSLPSWKKGREKWHFTEWWARRGCREIRQDHRSDWNPQRILRCWLDWQVKCIAGTSIPAPSVPEDYAVRTALNLNESRPTLGPVLS